MAASLSPVYNQLKDRQVQGGDFHEEKEIDHLGVVLHFQTGNERGFGVIDEVLKAKLRLLHRVVVLHHVGLRCITTTELRFLRSRLQKYFPRRSQYVVQRV